MNRAARGWTLVGVCVTLAWVHACSYLPFLADDALISARYGKRLAEGAGLTWNDGDRVEGYSDLLWVLAIAGLHAVGVDPVVAVRGLGLAGLALLVVAVGWDAELGGPEPRRVLSASAMTAATGSAAIWAVGGLEHTATAGLAAVGLVAATRAHESADRRATALAGLCFASVTLLRADGAVVPVLAALGWWVALGPASGTAPALRCLTPAVAAVVAQLALRAGWHHDIVPNTARAKVSLTAARAWAGVQWGLWGLVGHLPTALAAVLGTRAARGSAHRWMPAAAVAVGWTAYTSLVGGDVFPGWRQLVPALGAVGLLVGEGAARWATTPARTRALPLGAAVVLGFTALDPNVGRAHLERWEWAGPPFAEALLRAAAGRPVSIAVDAAGSLPYFTGLPAVDMLGLNDRWLALHPPASWGGSAVGHDLGDGAYVLARRPDVVAFGITRGMPEAMFGSGLQMAVSPIFTERYVGVGVTTGRGVMPGYWFVRRDGPLGERRTEDRIELPGAWLATEGLPGHVDDQGALVAQVGPDRIRYALVTVPAGTWEATSDPAGPVVTLGCGTPGTARLHLPTPRRIRVNVQAVEPVEIRSLLVRRVADDPGAGTCRRVRDEPLVLPLELAPGPTGPAMELPRTGLAVVPRAPLASARVRVRLAGARRAQVEFRDRGTVVDVVRVGPRDTAEVSVGPIDEIRISAGDDDRLETLDVQGDPFPSDLGD